MSKELIVAGYSFSSLEEANIARMELGKIEKLNEKLENADVSLLYKVYVKSIEKNTFKTPVGLEYLSELKNIIDKDGSFETVPIPVNPTNIVRNNDSDELKRLKNDYDNKKKIMSWSIFINVILYIVILIMFYITTTSNSPNVINYENAVIDKYSEWEQELSEREAIVKEKEASFNIFE